MEEKPPIRRVVVLNITPRGLLLRAALVLGVIVCLCVAGTLLLPGSHMGLMSKRDQFGVGPRYMPSIVPVSLEKGWVSSEFGMRTHPITGKRRMHCGIDLAVDEGVPIRTTADGKVIFAGEGRGYGKHVQIDHGNGIETRYAHASVLKVKAGDFVRRGQVISLAGHTGTATGDHLHYEVRVNGKPVNPREYLPQLIEGGRQRRAE